MSFATGGIAALIRPLSRRERVAAAAPLGIFHFRRSLGSSRPPSPRPGARSRVPNEMMLQPRPQKAKRQLRRLFAQNPLDRQGVNVHLHLVPRGRLGQSPRLDAVGLVVDHPPAVRRVAIETIDESLQIRPFRVGTIGRPSQKELDSRWTSSAAAIASPRREVEKR